MATNNRARETQWCNSDIILYQRISGGWEYQYTSDGETYRGFAHDPVLARSRLFNQLGWTRLRFDRADFRPF